MPNHAIAAATNAAVPVFSVGWMTGAKRGEWLDGMSLHHHRIAEVSGERAGDFLGDVGVVVGST